jgi:thiamine pyrophosphokinase
MNRVLGILGGGDMPPDLLKKWAETADFIIAADSGSDLAWAVGVQPDVVIGDLDSVSEEGLSAAKEIIRISDQTYTDCDKLLRHLEHLGVERATVASIEGDRLDHVLATLSSCAASSLKLRLALRNGVAEILKSGRHSFQVEIGETVSLMPLTKCSLEAFSGVEWPLVNVELEPSGLLSISNKAVQTCIEVSIVTGVAVLFRPLPGEGVPIW